MINTINLIRFVSYHDLQLMTSTDKLCRRFRSALAFTQFQLLVRGTLPVFFCSTSNKLHIWSKNILCFLNTGFIYGWIRVDVTQCLFRLFSYHPNTANYFDLDPTIPLFYCYMTSVWWKGSMCQFQILCSTRLGIKFTTSWNRGEHSTSVLNVNAIEAVRNRVTWRGFHWQGTRMIQRAVFYFQNRIKLV